MSPEYVRPYVKAQKNDDRDAEGIAEAASRPTMRFVGLNTQEQLDIQTLDRDRSRLVAERTNQINQLRAILLERGTIFPVGRRKLELYRWDAGRWEYDIVTAPAATGTRTARRMARTGRKERGVEWRVRRPRTQ